MAHQDMVNSPRRFRSIQLIIDRQNRTARIAKDVFDTVPPQTINEGKGS
ncbi:hypothetical protein [Neosynechococcus sphagnicola]